MKKSILQLLALAVCAWQIAEAAEPTTTPSPTGSPSRRRLVTAAPSSSPALRASPLPPRMQSAAAPSVPLITPPSRRTLPAATSASPTATKAATGTSGQLQIPSGGFNPATLGPAQVPGSAPIGNVSLPPKKPGVLEGKVPPMKIENARAPIAFAPFEPKDINSGQKISPSTMMKLPNGRQVEAGKYYDTLNKTEQSLNTVGMSLRQQKDIRVVLKPTYSKLAQNIPNVTVLTPAFKAKQFEVDKKMAETINRANADFKRRKTDGLLAKGKDKADSMVHPKTHMAEPASDSYLHNASDAMKVWAQQPTPPEFNAPSPPKDDSFGDPQYAAITFHAGFVKQISPLSMYFGANGRVGLALFSQQFPPAEISVGMIAELIGDKGLRASIKLPLLPAVPYFYPVGGVEEGGPAAPIEGSKGLDLNKEVRVTVMMGPIPITFAAGSKGSVGFKYTLATTATGSAPGDKPIDDAWMETAKEQTIKGSTFDLGLDGQVSVYGDVSLYASVTAGGELDLWICTVGATAGIKAETTIFQGGVTAHAKANITKPAGEKPHAAITFYADYGVDRAMAGRTWLEATLDFCVYHVTYEYNIWDQPGVSQPKTILFETPLSGDLF